MKKMVSFMLLALVITILFTNMNSVSASVVEGTTIEELGTYTITEPVMTRVKVYIDEGMVDFVRSTGVTVYTVETKYYFLGFYIYSTYDYYHYIDKYVDEIITQRTLYNDIDSLIFILNELDNFADDCTACEGDELNCVLGFIRSVHLDYSNTSALYGGAWGFLAGDVNEEFVEYVDDNDGSGLEISEYFSAFVPTHEDDTLYDKYLYNEDLHGDAYSYYEFLKSDSFDNNGLKQYKLIDPFNSNSYIDLLHLFASIDGIYNNTGTVLSFGNYHNRDILSWGGDLQQMASAMRDVNVSTLPTYSDIASGYANVNIDFCTFVGYTSCGFTEDDLLADIDAMNIAVTYLDNDINNNVAGAFSSYYNIISYDDSYFPNRYKMYLETVTDTIESDNPGTTTIEKFRYEVYITLDVKPSGDTYKNYYLILGETYIGYGLLRGSMWPTGGSLPNVELRGYLADLYIDYIEDMASRPIYYG